MEEMYLEELEDWQCFVYNKLHSDDQNELLDAWIEDKCRNGDFVMCDETQEYYLI